MKVVSIFNLRRPFGFALSLILSLILLEAGLRATGYLLTTVQNVRNLQYAESQDVVIVTLGESTTADATVALGKAWPRVLGEMLREHGVRARVLNLAAVGTNTTDLLNKFSLLLLNEHPNFVISMMGINDKKNIWLNESGLITNSESIFGNLRLIKLARLILNFRSILKLQSGAIQEQGPSIPPSSSLDFSDPRGLISRIQQGGLSEEAANKEIERFLESKPAFEKSRFYIFISNSIRPEWPEVHSDERSLRWHRYLKRAIESSLQFDTELQNFVILSNTLKLNQECKWLSDRLWNEDMPVSPALLDALVNCLPPTTPSLDQLLHRYGNYFLLKPKSPVVPTAHNYGLLSQLAREHSICLVAMQYPMRSLDSLKSYFSYADKMGRNEIAFVSNEQNFKAALSRFRWEEVFFDKFAGDFGHATEMGHQLIAESAFHALLNLLREGRCASGRLLEGQQKQMKEK